MTRHAPCGTASWHIAPGAGMSLKVRWLSSVSSRELIRVRIVFPSERMAAESMNRRRSLLMRISSPATSPPPSAPSSTTTVTRAAVSMRSLRVGMGNDTVVLVT